MTRKAKGTKPEKPREDFPLTAHPCGQWVKRVHGKLRYFGPWDDPEGALDEYARRRPEFEGHESSGTISIKDLCDRFLTSKQLLIDTQSLSQRTWDDYKAVADRIVLHFGPSRQVASLGGRDFELLWNSLPQSWSSGSRNNFVIRIKAVLNYAYNEDLVALPIKTGTVFKRSSQKQTRIARASKNKKFFEAAEIRSLVESASPHMAAMVLCGVNLGYGNADCARLTHSMIDMETGWVEEPRHKTGIHRMGKLWPETLDAIRKVKPRKNTPEEFADLIFVTRFKNPYWTDGGHDAISTAFYRLTEKCKCRRKGVGFYALRHVTQTIGDQVSDSLAVKILMGHVDSSISDKYREHFDRERIEKVCEHIRKWYRGK